MHETFGMTRIFDGKPHMKTVQFHYWDDDSVTQTLRRKDLTNGSVLDIHDKF